MSSDAILSEVMKLVGEYAGAKRIAPDMTLHQDLGIDGEDAVNLMTVFSERFNVELSDFDFRDHFGPEGCNPAIFVWEYIRRPRFIPISIRHLARCAEFGRWIRPGA